jgi:hypothetical protein
MIPDTGGCQLGRAKVGDYVMVAETADHHRMESNVKYLRSPIKTEIGGRPCTLLTIGHLAHALGRTPWTIRHWTRLGLLPPAPFDLRPEDPRRRRRLYPQPFVLALADIAALDYVGARLDRNQWQRFQVEVWEAYQATVVPLADGVADRDAGVGVVDTGGQGPDPLG